MRLFALLVLLISAVAQAGGSRVGNGGDGVYCPSSPNQPRLQLLDFYELSFYDNLTVDLGDVNEDPAAKVTKIIDSFKKISPIRAGQYQERLLNFYNRVQWSQGPLQDVPDSNHIVLPVGCEIRQLVIQSKVNGQPNYLVDQNLWQMLNGTQKAGLILHEIIYEEALEQGQINSINTRALVRYFAKQKFAVIDDLNDLNRTLFELEFHRLLEVAFENGDVGLLSRYSDYGDISIHRLSYYKFCGYFLKATKDYVNNCNEPSNYEFSIFGFQGSADYASRRINRIYSLKTNSIVFMVHPSVLNLDFPILDFHTGGFIPAEDMIFENKHFKTICEKEHWAFLRFGLEFNYFELDKNPVVQCGDPKNSNSNAFFKFDGMFYAYRRIEFLWFENLILELVKPAYVLVGKNKLEVKQLHLSKENEPMIFPGKKNLKIDLDKNGYCRIESYESKIIFLNDEDNSIEIILRIRPGSDPRFDYCHVKFKGIEYLNAHRVKVSKRGLGVILDVN